MGPCLSVSVCTRHMCSAVGMDGRITTFADRSFGMCNRICNHINTSHNATCWPMIHAFMGAIERIPIGRPAPHACFIYLVILSTQWPCAWSRSLYRQSPLVLSLATSVTSYTARITGKRPPSACMHLHRGPGQWHWHKLEKPESCTKNRVEWKVSMELQAHCKRETRDELERAATVLGATAPHSLKASPPRIS